MKKYFLYSILMINSSLLMSQNIAPTNVFIIQTNQSNVSGGNRLSNASRSNGNNQNNNRTSNIQQPTNLPRTGLNNLNTDAPYRGHVNENPVQNQSVLGNQNLEQTQQPYRNNQRNNLQEIPLQNFIENANKSIANDNNDPYFTNGNLEINAESVQNQQIHFLANNNSQNFQAIIPQINFEFNFEQQAQTITVTIPRMKEAKIKTFTPLELKITNIKNRNSYSESIISETTVVKIKTEKTDKHKGSSSYSQKNKSYVGKKIKIWCQKNFKFAKKIRMSVSCPKF